MVVVREQKTELEMYYNLDEQFLVDEFPLEQNIYCDSGHSTYKARWEAAFALRDKANYLQNRGKEEVWNNLMANFVFEDINQQASE